MAPVTNYLITGANRGIGLGLVAEYAKRPNNVIVAAVRDPAKSQALSAIVPASSSKIIIAKIDSSSETDALEAVAELQSKHGITLLNIVVANAGIANHWGPGATTPIDQLDDHFKINVAGPLILFQAVLPLLEKSPGSKFVTVSTAVGAVGEMENFPLPSTAYGTSKSALNYLTRKLHFEHPNLTIYPISPGWVQTDMGSPTAKALGLEDAPTTLADCIAGVSKSIDNATRESQSGKFASFDNSIPSW